MNKKKITSSEIDFIFCTAGSFFEDFSFDVRSKLAQSTVSSQKQTPEFSHAMKSYGNQVLKDTATVWKVNKTTTMFEAYHRRAKMRKCWSRIEKLSKKIQKCQRRQSTYHKFSFVSALSFFFDDVKPFVEVSIIV